MRDAISDRASYWRASGKRALVLAPFLSRDGNPLLVVRTEQGNLFALIELREAPGAWWRDAFGPDERARAQALDHVPYLRASGNAAVTGGLLPRGVHLAPWRSGKGIWGEHCRGRAFVAVDSQHRLVAQSDALRHENEDHVRQLLSVALDIADPPAPGPCRSPGDAGA